jgi:ATP/maltotriose-dependent transcriptional regulator MalT/DNA-binding SARP family transcriptional activator
MRIESVFPISKTKIIAPRRRAEIVTRPRLIETIHNLLTKKLMLISAPAGYGKTSLLIDMVDKSEIPICWLSLDIMDQEPQRFISYFIACIQERFPAFGTESTSMLMNAVSIEKENERLVVALTNEIYQAIHEHFAIVLDDYQFIDPVPEIRLFVNRFIQLAGEHCHLILASRLLPSLPDLHLLVARDQIGGMSLEDLTFSPEEIQALFNQNTAQALSSGDAEDIARKTDGWITSIALTGLSINGGSIQQRTPAAKTGIEIYDYFTREVLEKQPEDMRLFLLLTSLFDDVSITLCCAVLEPVFQEQHLDWAGLFNAVQSNNLFAIPVGNEGSYFRYHHLFQEYLQTKLQEENPQVIRDVMMRLAWYYREQRDWEKAHHIYENIGDQAAVIALIEEAGTFFIGNGRVVTLGNWLERLPVSVLQHNPKLLSLQGAVAFTQGEAQLGVSLLSQAETKFRVSQDKENLASTLVRRAAAYRELGDYPRALVDAEESITLIKDNKKADFQIMYALAQRVKGLALFRLGKTTEAVPLYENALQLLVLHHDKAQTPILEMELGAIHYTLGNGDTAIKYYLSALKALEASGNLGWQATLMNNLAVMHHSRGEYEKAFQMLEDAINCAQRSGYVRAQALALSSLGDLLTDLHEIERAEECYDQALIIASQLGYSFLVFYVSVAKARIARLGNRPGVADTLLRDLFVHLKQNTSAADEALIRMEYGCLLLNSNKTDEAVEELAHAINLYEQDGRVLEVCTGRLWLAAARMAAGETDAGTLQLTELLSAYKSLKEPAPLYAAAAEVQHWLEKYKLSQKTLAPLGQLFARADEFTKSIPSIRRNLRRISKSAFISSPHTTIQALGPARVFVNGKQVTLSDWQTRETRDLFFFFLESKPKTKEEIAAIFWPDISPARLKMRFKTSLYRLRHAVGQYTILFEGERYRFNHDIDYEYDLETYNELLEKARGEKNAAKSAELLQAAVDLVRGPYLVDVETEWADTERSQFEMQYHSILMRLAELYLESSQPERVIEICQTALTHNRMLEEAYQLMMRAYGLLGDRAAVARVYKTCSKILITDLGIKPSRETEKLYQYLI